MKRRILSLFCVLALCLGLLPTSALAAGPDIEKAIQLVDSGTAANISGAQADKIYFGNYFQSNNTTKEPVKWRVLSNSDGKLFLLSDQNLDVKPYNSSSTGITWEKSTIRSWLNGYAASENNSGTDYSSNNFIDAAFSSDEQVAIADTYVYNKNNPSYSTSGGNNTTAQIFLLSIEEANNSSYFPNGNDSRKSTNTAYVASYSGMLGAGKADYWWLRSPGGDDDDAAFVDDGGVVFNNGYIVGNRNTAVRPAFNLNLNSVLFTSAAAGGKSANGMDSGLTAVGGYDGNEWKLTLLDNSRNFSISSAKIEESKIDFSYSGAQTGANEYISVVIEEGGAITYYGRILQLDGTMGGASGEASLTLPADVTFSDTTKLYIFNEQYNGDKMTDYASQMIEVDTTAPKLSNGSATRDSATTATVKFTSNEAGSYYYVVDSSETLSDSIDTSGEGTSCKANEETEISIDSLSNGVQYIHIVVKDAVGNVSQPLTIQIPAYTFTVTVDVDPSEGGTASADSSAAVEGDEIELTASPNEGYHFKEWQVTPNTVSIGDDNKFTMPAEDVTVKAVFEAHSFTQKNTNSEYLASSATCTQAATYYKSCSCGAKGEETFTSGEALGHTWSDWTSNGSNKHTRTCSRCQATETESCTGGTANCTNRAVCTTCGSEYGEVNPANHTGQISWVQTETTHKQVYNCCNAVVIEETSHTWENGVCTVCQYPCTHTGGEATCTSKAVCTICNSQYGELNSNNHNPASEWTQENGKHYHICQNGCGTHLNEDNCTGGTATCTSKATCSVCGHEYGDYRAHDLTVHNAKEPTCTETGNSQYWECSVCKHLFSDAQGNTETKIADVTIAAKGHTPGADWKYNDSNHWKECEDCGAKVGETGHSYDDDGKCTVCGYEQPTYAISASPETLDFGSEAEGYADAPAAQIVTITNTGNQSVTVNLPTSAKYIITAGTGFENGTATLASDGTATFTVQPNTGLAIGSHSETLNISGSDGTSTSVKLSFTVNAIYTLTVELNGGSGSTTGGTYPAGEVVNIDAGSRSNYRFAGWTSSNGGTFADASSASTTFTMPAVDTTITANWQYNDGGGGSSRPSTPSTPTGPATGESGGWEEIGDEIGEAQPGETIVVDMSGTTEVPAEIFEEVAGKDVTVEFDLDGGVTWTVNGQDVPTGTDLSDLDLGVDLGTSGISANVINNITGEYGSVQITLAHDGEFGFTLTLSAPLGKENAGYWANLYHYDEDAEALNYETSAQVASDGTASLRMTHASQYAIIIDDQTHQLPFTDVASGAWYEGAMRYAYTHDIMEGTSPTTFVPNTSLTRAEAVQVLYNLEGQPAVSDSTTFPDLVEEWYKPAIAWAEQTGVVDGYEDGTFRPGQPVNRMEFAQMLYNYASYKGYDLSAKGDLTAFPDGDSVQEWALPAMAWANGNELINGHDDGTLDPAGTTTRVQAASILMRFDLNVAEN